LKRLKGGSVSSSGWVSLGVSDSGMARKYP
jgi:hypothetical protein